MAISREAARHNLQMIADGETLHVGEDGLLHIGGGNQARVQGVVNQTLAYNSLRYVNTGHLQERIQSVTGHVFDITPAELNSELFGEDFKREVRVAFEAGNLELLRFLLPQGRELSVESLNGAVMAASKNGHLEVVRFLLPQGRELSQGIFASAVCGASGNGHLEVVRFLLSRGRELSVKSLDLAVCGASGNGHLDVVRFLLSEGRELSVESLDRVVWVASGNGHLDVVRFLLPEGRELSQSSRNHAVWMASDDGHLDVVRFLLPQGQELSQKILDSVVYGASGNGHLDVVRFLLSEGRELSQEVLNNAVAGAFENGYLEVLLFLLSQGTVGINSRNGIALRASSDGHPDILETVLRNGPIYQSTLGSCRTQATAGENRQRILDLLDSAPVIPDPSRDGSAPSIAGSTSLTLSDVKEHPQVYLDRLAADGVPRRVSLLDNPKAVDLGGVTRQYLTTLFGALLEKGAIRVNDEGTPSAEQDQDKEVLQKVGQVFSHLVKRNRTRTDKFLVGELFSERFYKLVHMVAAEKEGLLEAALEGSIYAEMDEPADYVEPQLEAAKCFYAGLDDETRALFAANANLQDAFQGQSCTKEALLAAIRFSDVDEQEAWIREMIEGSDPKWRQRFVFALTGNKTLAPGLRLEVRRGWRPVFEFHTCFNSLDVPAGMTKEDFIAGVNASLIGEDYNIG